LVRAWLAREQRFDGTLRRQVLVEHAIHDLTDRHLDPEGSRQLSQILRSRNALGDMT